MVYKKRVKKAESRLNYVNKRAAAMSAKGVGGSRKFSTFSKSNKRYFSTLPKNNNNNKSLTEVEAKFNAKLSTFLSNVSSILSENKDNPYNAQLTIESKWVEISFNNSDLKSSLYSNNRKIIYASLELLNLYKSNGNLNRIGKPLVNYLVNIDHVYITFSVLLSSYNNSSLTNIDYNIGLSIIKHIYFKELKNDFDSFESFINLHKLDSVFFIKLGDVFVETFTSPLNPVFERFFFNDYYVIKINPDELAPKKK